MNTAFILSFGDNRRIDPDDLLRPACTEREKDLLLVFVLVAHVNKITKETGVCNGSVFGDQVK